MTAATEVPDSAPEKEKAPSASEFKRFFKEVTGGSIEGFSDTPVIPIFKNAGKTDKARSELPDAATLFADVIAKRGWSIREPQRIMMEAVATMLSSEDDPENWEHGITTNAPVGTGKTLAYLIAAIATDARIAVVTSTKALQDQIYYEELPKLAADLKELYDFDLTYSFLKGQGNYPCIRKLVRLISGNVEDEDEDDLFTAELGDEAAATIGQHEKQVVEQIIARVREGIVNLDPSKFECTDLLAELPVQFQSRIMCGSGCPHRGAVWRVGSGEDTPERDPAVVQGNGVHSLSEAVAGSARTIAEVLLSEPLCAYRAAYAIASACDIVVLNTSLLAAEIKKAQDIRDRYADEDDDAMPAGYYLHPSQVRGSEVVIIDEGHHVVNKVMDHLSIEARIVQQVAASETQTDRIVTLFSETDDARGLVAARHAVHNTLADLSNFLVEEKERMDAGGRWKKVPLNRKEVNEYLTLAREQILGFRNRVLVAMDNNGDQGNKAKKALARYMDSMSDLLGIVSAAKTSALDPTTKEWEPSYDLSIRVVEDRFQNRHPVLRATPIDVRFFRDSLADLSVSPDPYRALSGVETRAPHSSHLVLCSGTITQAIAQEVGMDYGQFVEVPSPFDHDNGRIYIADDLVNPNDSAWLNQAFEFKVAPAIQWCDGRTLFLCTSARRVVEFAELIRERFGDEYTVLDQGMLRQGFTRGELIRMFADDERSILIGTNLFWEGVDIPGPSLTQVIIDRIMYPNGDDDVFEARRKAARRRGLNDFDAVNLVHAQTMIAQGAGRLLRSHTDKGGIMFLDSRLAEKRHRRVLDLVEATSPVTKDVEVYLEWVRSCAADPSLSKGRAESPEWELLRRTVKRPAARRRMPTPMPTFE